MMNVTVETENSSTMYRIESLEELAEITEFETIFVSR